MLIDLLEFAISETLTPVLKSKVIIDDSFLILFVFKIAYWISLSNEYILSGVLGSKSPFQIRSLDNSWDRINPGNKNRKLKN